MAQGGQSIDCHVEDLRGLITNRQHPTQELTDDGGLDSILEDLFVVIDELCEGCLGAEVGLRVLKHGLFDDEGAKVIRRELKHSSFKRSFELGELLDGDNIKASFKDGLLSIDIPKAEPELPKKTSVKIS